MRILGRAVGAVTIAALALVLVMAPAAGAGSLYKGPGPRPGPDLLYSKAPVAPQLQNVAPWKVPPLLISGSEAYRNGEFLYQDYLYDDHGATRTPDPADPFNAA